MGHRDSHSQPEAIGSQQPSEDHRLLPQSLVEDLNHSRSHQCCSHHCPISGESHVTVDASWNPAWLFGLGAWFI
jgi:hypothetical protein